LALLLFSSTLCEVLARRVLPDPGSQSRTTDQRMLPYIGTMAEAKPGSIAIYRRGPAWITGKKLREQPSLLDHGHFLAGLERTHQAIHAATSSPGLSLTQANGEALPTGTGKKDAPQE
jgi:hypothetical protein